MRSLLLLELCALAGSHAALAQLAVQPSGSSTSGGGGLSAGSSTSGDEAAGSLSREIIRTLPAQGGAGAGASGPQRSQQQSGRAAGELCANGLTRVQCLVDPCALSSCPTGTACVSDYCGGCFATCVHSGGSGSSNDDASPGGAPGQPGANATCAANRAPCNCTSDCCSAASICVSYTPGGGGGGGDGSGATTVTRRTGTSAGTGTGGRSGTAALRGAAAGTGGGTPGGGGGSGRRLLLQSSMSNPTTGTAPWGTSGPTGGIGSSGTGTGTAASGRVLGPVTAADPDGDGVDDEPQQQEQQEEPTVTNQAPAGVLLTVRGGGNGSGTCVSRRVVGAVQRRLQLSAAASGAEGRATGNLTEFAC
ncbi:hypothetical protein HYH02_004968 [Chlamydomonas schloesseri]|uniref:Uncharacterized protein n=1 Tax=Chlamydomonas schloesseri TaxID=2026947 RepID=A0A835WP50_9CHLO|nr:hypothetical protein HYH02_004968 [Chlamydomonas schloesseri]|eukprot:KAG2450466.1 hypothetical protein HYH02_004968 [Chlamydomonas schloesseri]